jgi:hypothetical protein
VNKKIIDCDWKYLSTLRTAQAPHEPMPTLVDLLTYLALPEQSGIWLILDIKVCARQMNHIVKIGSGAFVNEVNRRVVYSWTTTPSRS